MPSCRGSARSLESIHACQPVTASRKDAPNARIACSWRDASRCSARSAGVALSAAMRSPYGGLATMNPGVSNGGREHAASTTRVAIACAGNPARSRFRRVCSIARGSMSEAARRGAAPSRGRFACARRIASARSEAHSFESWSSSFSSPNARDRPGATSKAICAASITIVPEPQNGSYSGVAGVHLHNASSPAARFSFSGASPLSSRPERQPRLNSGSPLRSRYSVACRSSRNANTRASGARVSIDGRSPVRSRNRSTMPSFTRSVAKFRLRTGECTALRSTRRLWLASKNRSHSMPSASRYRSSSSR